MLFILLRTYSSLSIEYLIILVSMIYLFIYFFGNIRNWQIGSLGHTYEMHRANGNSTEHREPELLLIFTDSLSISLRLNSSCTFKTRTYIRQEKTKNRWCQLHFCHFLGRKALFQRQCHNRLGLPSTELQTPPTPSTLIPGQPLRKRDRAFPASTVKAGKERGGWE